MERWDSIMENFDAIATKNKSIYEKKYIKKEQFVEMLQNLDFVAIERANIDFITLYMMDVEEDSVEPKGFRLELY